MCYTRILLLECSDIIMDRPSCPSPKKGTLWLGPCKNRYCSVCLGLNYRSLKKLASWPSWPCLCINFLTLSQANAYISISFTKSIIMVCECVCVCVCPPEVTSPAAANGPIDMISLAEASRDSAMLLSMYITYNLVSIPTPWAVAGSHGQLASPLWAQEMFTHPSSRALFYANNCREGRFYQLLMIYRLY